MRPLVHFQGPLITFQGPPLGQVPERVQLTIGALGIAFLIGTVIWLSRGGVERLPHRKTQPWDF
jgi:hypothetical protein